MESVIIDLLDFKRIQKMSGESEEMSFYQKKRQETEAALLAELNENGKKLFAAYQLDADSAAWCQCYESEIEVLYLGIKIGMEIQEAFRQMEE